MKQCMGCMEVYQDNLKKCPKCGYEEGTMPENTIHMEPGSILNNRYIIGKVLGYGGFGVTYIAWDTLLEQKVAIKEFLPSEFATRMLGRLEITIFSGDKQKQFMEGLVKFVEEAKKIAKFNNVPGIVKIFDCIEENNTAYIIMEYLEGETLADKIEREKKMKPDMAINLLLPVMDALKRVNSNGIIHRDIAPDNIFITSKGEPKLIDFGAARYATTSLSRSLTIIIKPGYSPEEQYRSMKDQGSWTDVYSIGATLYKMITGETPCDSMERRAHFEQHNTDLLKPISKFNSSITKNQEIAIMNALNVRIEDRTMNMAQLINELTLVTDVKRIQASHTKTIEFPKISFKAKVICLVAILIGTLSIGIASYASSQKEILAKGMTRVPNVQNLSIETAKKKLESYNLQPYISGYVYSVNMLSDCVVNQSVEAGKKVKENTKIDLSVCKINSSTEMANVLGMKQAKAIELLEREGHVVKVAQVPQYNDSIAKGCVVRQELYINDSSNTVHIFVSAGREKRYINLNEGANVGVLEGNTFADCIRQAREENFMLEVTERSANEKKAGTVLSQSIESVSNVRKGTIVQITVSKGIGEEALVDYTDWMIDDARKDLLRQGLKIEIDYQVNANVEHGKIMEQTPGEGTKLKTGDTVSLVVSIGPEEFNMVNLYRKTKEEAEWILESYGLKYKIVDGYHEGVEEGCVYYQSIANGTKTKVNAEIIVKIRNSESENEIPDVVGKKVSDVEKELTDIGFKVKLKKEFSPTVEKNIVMSISPDVGSKLKVGSNVTVVYSGGLGEIAAVADTKGMDEPTARATLEQQGLKVKVSYAFSETDTVYTVLSQDIKAGEQASKDDEITITVSKGKKAKIVMRNEENGVIKVSEGTTTQLVASVTPIGNGIDMKVENSDLAMIQSSSSEDMSTSGEASVEGYTQFTAKIQFNKKGTTNIIVTVHYIDGTTSTSKHKLVIE